VKAPPTDLEPNDDVQASGAVVKTHLAGVLCGGWRNSLRGFGAVMSERSTDIAVIDERRGSARKSRCAQDVVVPARRRCDTGSHVGCSTAVCGACSVARRRGGGGARLPDEAVMQCDGARRQDTIEGVAGDRTRSPIATGVNCTQRMQCGPAQPGMLITAQDLLARGGIPSREQIRPNQSLRKILPLHRISSHRRRGRGGWRRRRRERSGERAQMRMRFLPGALFEASAAASWVGPSLCSGRLPAVAA